MGAERLLSLAAEALSAAVTRFDGREEEDSGMGMLAPPTAPPPGLRPTPSPNPAAAGSLLVVI